MPFIALKEGEGTLGWRMEHGEGWSILFFFSHLFVTFSEEEGG